MTLWSLQSKGGVKNYNNIFIIYFTLKFKNVIRRLVFFLFTLLSVILFYFILFIFCFLHQLIASYQVFRAKQVLRTMIRNTIRILPKTFLFPVYVAY